MARRGYPPEFRRRALDLVAAGKTVAEVARLLEVSDQSIYTWRRQELIDRSELPGLSSEEREELWVARRRIKELETELAVHRRAGGAVEGVGAPKRRYEAISVMAGEGLPIEVACRVLDVSCSGYYAWRFRPPSARAVRHAWLTDVIRQVHAASYCTYGAKRVYAELKLGRGIQVGHNAVAMLMQRAGIVGRSGARKRYGIPSIVIADDLVDRMFVRGRPNQLWLTDITEHPTRDGLLRLRLGRVQPPSGRLGDQPQPDHHADLQRARDGDRATRGGARYDGDSFGSRSAIHLVGGARKSGLVPSMGSIGDCYDNSMIEAFWSRMQVELLDARRWKTRVELANAIFEYIEIFHNRRRRHSALGMRTPIQYEQLQTATAA